MFDPSGPGAKGRAELLKSVTRLVKGAVEGLAADIRGIDESVSATTTPSSGESSEGKRSERVTPTDTVFDAVCWAIGRAWLPSNQDEEVRNHDHPERQVSPCGAAGKFGPSFTTTTIY